MKDIFGEEVQNGDVIMYPSNTGGRYFQFAIFNGFEENPDNENNTYYFTMNICSIVERPRKYILGRCPVVRLEDNKVPIDIRVYLPATREWLIEKERE